MIKMTKASKQDIADIRAIAKKYGIKGCRQPLHAVHVGKQTTRIDPKTAREFIHDLNVEGFITECEDYRTQEIFDVILVWVAA